MAGLLLLPAVAGGEPMTPVVDSLRAVERAAGKVAAAAAALQQTAGEVAASDRLHALARLADQQAALERELARLQRAVGAAKAALPVVENRR